MYRPALAIVLLSTSGCGLFSGGPEDFEGDAPGECADAADNDRDGLFDCDDPDCIGSPDCTGEPTPTASPTQVPEVDADADVDADTDSDVDADTDADTDPSTLIDMSAFVDLSGCEGQALWNDPGVSMAAVQWVSTHLTNGTATETAYYLPNPRFASQGFSACEVTWTGTSTHTAGALSGSVSVDSSTCATIGGQEIYVGDETYTVDYTLIETPPDVVDAFFAGGAQAGAGFYDASGWTWLSSVDCKVY
jgi:hypothetical protein